MSLFFSLDGHLGTLFLDQGFGLSREDPERSLNHPA